jgi:hypothetical protein
MTNLPVDSDIAALAWVLLASRALDNRMYGFITAAATSL